MTKTNRAEQETVLNLAQAHKLLDEAGREAKEGRFFGEYALKLIVQAGNITVVKFNREQVFKSDATQA